MSDLRPKSKRSWFSATVRLTNGRACSRRGAVLTMLAAGAARAVCANANAKLSDQRQRQRQRQAFWPWQKHGQACRPPRTPNRQPRNDFNSPPTQQASPIGEPRASKKQSSERPGIGKGAARGGPGKPLPVGQRHSHLPAIPRVWEIAPAGRPERLRAGRTANVRG